MIAIALKKIMIGWIYKTGLGRSHVYIREKSSFVVKLGQHQLRLSHQ
jgi:hypothetical protein